MAEGDLNVVGTTPKLKKGSIDYKIVAIVGVVVLILGALAGMFLIRQNQNVEEEAQSSLMCPAAEQCPSLSNPSHLLSCSPGDTDGTASDSLCSTAGRIEVCGGRQYCCPSPNGAWTTNLALCPQVTETIPPTPTPEATESATSTPVATATPTSLVQATPTATGTSLATLATRTPTSTPNATNTAIPGSSTTPFPVPETGMGITTVAGIGVGLLLLVLTFAFAL